MRAQHERECRATRFVRLTGACSLAALLGACGADSTPATASSAGTPGAGGATASGGSGGGGAGPGNSTTASASLARRLSRSEYANVVRDVLGTGSDAIAKYLADDEYLPFDNDYTAQTPSRALIESLEATADEIAASALSPENRAKIVPCTPSGAGDTACLRRTIEGLGRRLYRRPLSEPQVSAYLTLQSFATETGPGPARDFYTAVNLVLRSMLQDPEVLYRIEVGTPTVEPGIFQLDSDELASRLSFLLWGSGPDDALLDQAQGDGLLDPTARRTAATRLLADARARGQLQRFHAMWLGYRSVPASAEFAAAFNLETNKLIDQVLFEEPSSYLDLFRSPRTYVNPLLASQYGLQAPAGGEGWVDYESDERAGILSHGSVLAAFSKFSDTSPTQRGIFVQTRLLCNKVAPPPANVNVDQPPSEGEGACKLERYEAHRKLASCNACHAQLDPIGYGLENYDIAGRYRTHDDGNESCVLPGSGELPGYGTFSGPGQLARLLIESGELEQCFVQHLMSYAVGRELRPEEEAARDALLTNFKDGDYSVQQLLLAMVADPRFALRQEDQEVMP